jgi:hypothetical protein
MMTLIGYRWKGRNVFSQVVLITRKLAKTFKIVQDGKNTAKYSGQGFMVVMAMGLHLFPFRTEKLSPSAQMVLP